jgi:hypothetical protein
MADAARQQPQVLADVPMVAPGRVLCCKCQQWFARRGALVGPSPSSLAAERGRSGLVMLADNEACVKFA